MKRLAPAILLLGLGWSGCSTSPLDDPLNVNSRPDAVVVGDSVFVRSPNAGAIIRIRPGPQGDSPYTELKDSQLELIHVGEFASAMRLTPDRTRLLVLEQDYLENHLAIVDLTQPCTGETPVDTGCVTSLPARPNHDQLVISPDGRFAISSISADAQLNAQTSVVNLNEIAIYDLSVGDVAFASVGFGPKGFAFTQGSSDPRAVVITDSKVVLIDLSTGETTSRELTLDSGTRLTPTQVSLTADDHYALVTVEDRSDLFTFDLTSETFPVNILTLGGEPMQMGRKLEGEQTFILVMTSTNTPELNVVQNQEGTSTLEVERLELPSYVDTMYFPSGADYAAFYRSDGSSGYLHRVELSTLRMQSYLLDNPCIDVRSSASGAILALFYEPTDSLYSYYNYSNTLSTDLSQNYAVALLDVAAGERQPNPILVPSLPRDALFLEGASADQDRLFVATASADYGVLARISLDTYATDELHLPPNPRSLGTLDTDGRVVVVHDSTTGILSVFPPNEPEKVQFITGFRTQGVL